MPKKKHTPKSQYIATKQDEQSREERNRKQINTMAGQLQHLHLSTCLAATRLENSALDLEGDLRKDFKNNEVLLFPS